MFWNEDTSRETIKISWENIFIEQCMKLKDSQSKKIALLKISHGKAILH